MLPIIIKKQQVLFEEAIAARCFNEWSMGFRRLLSDNDIGYVSEMNSFLKTTQPLDKYLTSQPHFLILLNSIFMYFKQQHSIDSLTHVSYEGYDGFK